MRRDPIRHLVIVRAGDASLHPSWLAQDGGRKRNWDLIVNYYGDDPDLYCAQDIRRIDSKGPKWPALYDLFDTYPDLADGYDYIWFPDDDLACASSDIDRMFDLCAAHKLELAQPSLTQDSHIGVSITVTNRSFILRYTNFVEVMAPCFSAPFLTRCRPSFNINLSGWGLDFLWPTYASDPRKVAILDAVTVKHTRPLGGPNYALMKERGIDPDQELHALLASSKIKFEHVIRGGIASDGQEFSIWNNGQAELIRLILAGYLPEFMHYPDILYKMIEPVLETYSGKSSA